MIALKSSTYNGKHGTRIKKRNSKTYRVAKSTRARTLWMVTAGDGKDDGRKNATSLQRMRYFLQRCSEVADIRRIAVSLANNQGVRRSNSHKWMPKEKDEMTLHSTTKGLMKQQVQKLKAATVEEAETSVCTAMNHE